jgi:hypothetical protein
MREQEVRERIELFLRTTLRTTVLPAALGVGVGLTSACRAHGSPDSGPLASTERGSSRISRGDGSIDSACSKSHAAANQTPDAGGDQAGDASQPDPFPHSLLRAQPPDARPQGPGLNLDPGMPERHLKKARAIYSAPMYKD